MESEEGGNTLGNIADKLKHDTATVGNPNACTELSRLRIAVDQDRQSWRRKPLLVRFAMLIGGVARMGHGLSGSHGDKNHRVVRTR
ncbi:MAG TPA: hypothetical protein PK765_04740 [bacterium]|nr:hypothetical protein [bacterium]